MYSSDGILLTEFYKEENRDVVPLNKISKNMISAVLAIEDSDFYNHHGISIKGIFRALFRDIVAGGFAQGGSTITQQVAKNVFLTHKKSIDRKIKEVILAIMIDIRYPKDKILEIYLNQIYFANNLYGIETASQFYFGKHASDLRLSEASLIAGIIKAPEYYNPITHFDRAKQQQKIVLNRMVQLGMFTEQEAQGSYDRHLYFSSKTRPIKAPYFVAFVFDKLHSLYGDDLFLSGYKIYTTLNYRMQKITENVVRGWSYNSLNMSQIAVLGCDRYGRIEVMQGGIDFYKSQLNRTYQTKRQMGSVFKPLVYLTAIEKGLSPYSWIDDYPITIGSYTPHNYNNEQYGTMTLTQALAHSNNIATIKIQERVGRSNVVKNAKLFGITTQPYVSLALGVHEASLFGLVQMYNTFGNLGKMADLYGIERIEDKHGRVVYQHQHKIVQLLSEDNVKPLDEMLKSVVDYGTGRNANLGRMVAGKTGTTTDYKDAWFLGFTNNETYGVWVGNDNNDPMYKVTGGLVPAKIWKNIMQYRN